MTDSKQSNEPREDRLNELIAEYMRRVDRGEDGRSGTVRRAASRAGR